MTYKELLHLYKNGQLDNEQREQVEKDIEKQEAISEFLFENDEFLEFDDLEIKEKGISDENDFGEEKFLKMIKKSIRRAFFKMGVAVGVIVLAIVLFVNTALPQIVDTQYYNPGALLGEKEGIETNQMSLDTSVYTELFTPGYYRCKVDVDSEGYGNYDIQIIQNFSVTGQFKDVYGTVEKGKMSLFSDGLFEGPTGNAFVPDDTEILSDFVGVGAAGTREDALKVLEDLNDHDYYIGYITLDKVMTYDELVNWCESEDVDPEWCAVCRKEDTGYAVEDIIGLKYSSTGSDMYYDEKTYPYLNYFDLTETVDSFDEPFSAEVMETHMISMLRYMDDRDEFCEMVGYVNSYDIFSKLADNIEENGLNIYGIAVVGQKDLMIELSQKENVHYIYTTLLN